MNKSYNVYSIVDHIWFFSAFSKSTRPRDLLGIGVVGKHAVKSVEQRTKVKFCISKHDNLCLTKTGSLKYNYETADGSIVKDIFQTEATGTYLSFFSLFLKSIINWYILNRFLIILYADCPYRRNSLWPCFDWQYCPSVELALMQLQVLSGSWSQGSNTAQVSQGQM